MSAKNYEAWDVQESDFPEKGTEEQMEFLLRYAVLAPSGPNTQPWRFSVDDNCIQVYADLSRRLPVVDPSDRTLYMSVGCSIANLLIAADHFGFKSKLDLFPRGQGSDLVAKVVLDQGGKLASPGLFPAITLRYTIKDRYEDRKVGREDLAMLKMYADQPGFRLDYFSDDETKSRIADMEEEAHKIQIGSREFRRDLARWLRPNNTSASDGMPLHTCGVPGAVSLVFPSAFKAFDLSPLVAKKDVGLIKGSAAMAVLSSSSDDKLSWVKSGMILERLFLAATLRDIRLSFFSQPIGLPDLRKEIGKIARAKYPQLLFSLGYSKPSRHTPRRTVEEVLIRD
jgi:hypothetical protein